MSSFYSSSSPPPREFREFLDSLESKLDPRRLQRGLAGFRAGAVVAIWWGPGWLGGEVRGRSGSQRPEVWLEAGVPVACCDCSDSVSPCAHAPALAAAAWKALQEDPGLLRRFQGEAREETPSGPSGWLDFWGREDPDGPSILAERTAEFPPRDVQDHLESAPKLPGDVSIEEVVGDLYVILGEAPGTKSVS